MYGTANTRLARRMGIYVILASTFITLFTSAFQLYGDFLRDLDTIDLRLNEIEQTHLTSISSRVWVMDHIELQDTLSSLLRLPSFQYIEVTDNDRPLVVLGHKSSENIISKSFPLHYLYHGEQQLIGNLYIEVTLENTYQLIYARAFDIIISNAIKTFIISGIILVIFYRLVSRHLSVIGRFAASLEVGSLQNTLILDRKKPSDDQTDELDLLVHALTSMQHRLESAITEIKQRENKLAITLNSIGDAVITTDVSCNITSMNRIAEKLTGWTLLEAKGKKLNKVFSIIDTSTRNPIENPIENVLLTGETVYLSNHTTLIARNKKEYQIADSAAPIRNEEEEILGLVLVFNDITEQYRLRELAAKNKRDLQAIVDHSPAVIYVKDLKGCYLFINQQYEKLFQVHRDDIVGEKGHTTMPQEFTEQFHLNDQQVLDFGRPFESEESMSRDAELLTYVSVKFPLFDEEDEIYAVCGISTDITERKLKDEQLRRSQKMDALGNLSGGIAHDYNNILGVILGYAEQIHLFKGDADKVAKYSLSIQHAAERGSKLAKKLLTFSRQDKHNTEVLSINAILHDQKHMLEKSLTVRHRLSYQLEEHLWRVELDAGELEDAILNLSINALHAMDTGGQLTISTSNVKLYPIDVQALEIKTGDYVLLNFTDTGCGMDDSVKGKIFDPFFSTKGEQGTGLGLSQVYGFTRRSGGTVKVYSELGHGSRFALYFPRSKQSILEAPTSANIDLDVMGSEILLIVDDEQDIADLGFAIFTAQGYQVFTANDGRQALSILKKEKIDLIVSDVIMPIMDGYQLADEVRKLYPKIKIQMVSGFSDDRHVGLANHALHENLLQKPYTSTALLHKVRHLLDEEVSAPDLSGRTVLVMDDDSSMLDLFEINLQALHCNIIKASNGEKAITLYKNAMNTNSPVDIMIVDLVIPGGIGGKEMMKEVRSLDPEIKIIVASGNSEGDEMKNPHAHGFNGAFEKKFQKNALKEILEKVLIC